MYETILVPVDGSPAATAGLDEAIRIAVHTGARLHLMNVVDDMAFSNAAEAFDPERTAGGKLGSMVREGGEKVLRQARARAEAKGVFASTALVRSAAEHLQALVARHVEESGADLVVLGTHAQRRLSRLFMSDESEHLLNVVGVPVLLVRSAADGPGVSVVEITTSDSVFQPTP